jgi:hypothetical protein
VAPMKVLASAQRAGARSKDEGTASSRVSVSLLSSSRSGAREHARPTALVSCGTREAGAGARGHWRRRRLVLERLALWRCSRAAGGVVASAAFVRWPIARGFAARRVSARKVGMPRYFHLLRAGVVGQTKCIASKHARRHSPSIERTSKRLRLFAAAHVERYASGLRVEMAERCSWRQ